MFGGRFVQHLRVGARGWRQGWQHGNRGGGAASPSGSGRPPLPNGGRSALHQTRNIAAAAGAAGAALSQLVSRAGLKLAGGAMVLGGGLTVMTREQQQELERHSETAKLPWVQELAARPGMREVLVPGQMLRQHPVGQLVTEADHLFETMLKSEQIREFRCFFDPSARRFHSVVALGKDVCGYPSTVHGGLTAAIVDETLGGLYTALLASGGLGLRLPGLTARLEVDYKKRLSAPSVIHVATEVESVEPRKVWMKATVTDGGDVVYATARALFVAPNLGRAFVKGLQRPPAGGAANVPGAAVAAAAEGGKGGGRGRVQEAVA